VSQGFLLIGSRNCVTGALAVSPLCAAEGGSLNDDRAVHDRRRRVARVTNHR
jgi:hypothetical protein